MRGGRPNQVLCAAPCRREHKRFVILSQQFTKVIYLKCHYPMKRMFAALSQTDEGAMVLDEQFRIVFWNRGAQAILGRSAKQVVGRPCYEVLGGVDQHGRPLCQRHCRLHIGAMRGEAVPNMDLKARTHDGEPQWLNLTSFAISSGGSSSRQLLVHIFRDVTQLKTRAEFTDEIIDAAQNLQAGRRRTGTIARSEKSGPPDPAIDALTRRERQVLRLLAHGLGTDALAGALSISPATARNHIQRILEKLGVHSRLEAVAYAYQHGLVEPNGE